MKKTKNIHLPRLRYCRQCGLVNFRQQFNFDMYSATCYDNDCSRKQYSRRRIGELRFDQEYSRQLLKYINYHTDYHRMIVWMLCFGSKNPEMYYECYDIISNLEDVKNMIKIDKINSH